MSPESSSVPNGRPLSVLVVDDDAPFRDVMKSQLAGSGHRVQCVDSGEAALECLAAQAFDVILLDLRLPGLGGLDTLQRIQEAVIPCEVVVLTGAPDYEDCVSAMKLGAFHYLLKPTTPALIEDTLRRAGEHFQLRRENVALRRMLPDRAPELVGDSPAIRAVLEQARRIAPTDSRVVILGESGTGKGILARMLHELSPRRKRVFLDIHCGAVPKELQESELFGHERGAFTGAVADRPGVFELADGGTLFLDEFADMTPEMQSKLLKVLEAGEFRRVGGVRLVRADVRILAASNRNLDELVRTGHLRADLLHRVDVIRITLPPLRDRPEDVPRLVEHFLEQHQRRGLPRKRVTPQALRALQSYPWPGNVRELANTIERLMILAPGALIDVEHLSEHLRSGQPPLDPDDLALTLEDLERRHILRVLDSADGNMTVAARQLGVDRGTLTRKLKQWKGGAGGPDT